MLRLTVIAVTASFLAANPALAGDSGTSSFEVHKSGAATVKNTDGKKLVKCGTTFTRPCQTGLQRINEAISSDRFKIKTPRAVTATRQ